MGGRVFPETAPRTDHEPERRVWQALRDQLSEGWVAFHSMRVRAKKRFGEGDFIIAVPDYGVLVLEVKGGEIEHSGETWLQNGKPMPDGGPLQQAHGFKGKLIESLREQGVEVPVGVACCFPQTSSGTFPTDRDLRDVVMFENHLAEIVPMLEAAAEATMTRGNVPRDSNWVDVLHDLWGREWSPRIGFLDRIKLGQKKVDRLNAQQLEILDSFGRNPVCTVAGGAGTGKTTVAVEVATRRAYQGERVLYVCFTDALAKWVDMQFASLRDMGLDIRARALRARATEIASKEFGRELPTPSSPPSEWKAMVQGVADKLRDASFDRPAFIVVDEGQSFDDADWSLVEALMTDDTDAWVFHDPHQRFLSETEMPKVFLRCAQLDLPRQERSPRSIAALAGTYSGSHSLEEFRQAYVPEEVRLTVCGSDPAYTVARELDRLVELGVGLDEIAVVTLVGQSASKVWGAPRLGEYAFVHGDDERAPQLLVVETFLRFQGLDRPVLIVCEAEHPTALRSKYEARMHMALTRASGAVVIVAGDAAMDVDGRLLEIKKLQAFCEP